MKSLIAVFIGVTMCGCVTQTRKPAIIRVTKDHPIKDFSVRYRPFDTPLEMSALRALTNLSDAIEVMDRKKSISANGRFVSFRTIDSGLLPSDTNVVVDVFVFDQVTKKMECISTPQNGHLGNGMSLHHAISGDGRCVAFSSQASNLVTNDTNNKSDVFVFDRTTKTIDRLSVGPNGEESNGDSLYPPISSNGRFVAFASEATNLVAGDTNQHMDVFVVDRKLRKTELISKTFLGLGNGDSTYPSISANGRFVVFTSRASNLVENDRNNVDDVFRFDRLTGTMQRVSVGDEGKEANGPSYNYNVALTVDGNRVVFASRASNLHKVDTNNNFDVFIRDFSAGTTRCLSTNSFGATGNGRSMHPTIAATSGRFVSFQSAASDLSAGPAAQFEKVYRKDLKTGVLVNLCVTPEGITANGASYRAAISGDGKSVAFSSEATNLDPSDDNGSPDGFLVRLP